MFLNKNGGYVWTLESKSCYFTTLVKFLVWRWQCVFYFVMLIDLTLLHLWIHLSSKNKIARIIKESTCLKNCYLLNAICLSMVENSINFFFSKHLPLAKTPNIEKKWISFTKSFAVDTVVLQQLDTNSAWCFNRFNGFNIKH